MSLRRLLLATFLALSPVPSQAANPTHIVVVIQENRTPDNLLNGYTAPDGSKASSSMTGYDSSHASHALRKVGLEVPCDPNHAYGPNATQGGFVSEYNSGTLFNGQPANWDKQFFDCGAGVVNAATATLPDGAFAYVPAVQTIPYQLMIGNDGLYADEAFQANAGPSYPAHLFAETGSSGGIVTNNVGPITLPANDIVTENPVGFFLSGCASPGGVQWIDKTLTFPAANTQQTLTGTCSNLVTIQDRLEAASFTTKTYANSHNTFWSMDDMIYGRYLSAPDSVPSTNFFADVGNCALPNLVFITPSNKNSDHAIGAQVGSNAPTGPQWVASIVNAIGNSTCWTSTVIIIYWDDWGGWYDHVPAQCMTGWGLPNPSYGCGFRVPFIVVSPYVVAHKVDHTVRFAQCSTLKFIENIFSVANLGTCDTTTPNDNLSSLFNFAGTANAFVPIPGTGSGANFVAGPFLYVSGGMPN
jgi:phospholipase C